MRIRVKRENVMCQGKKGMKNGLGFANENGGHFLYIYPTDEEISTLRHKGAAILPTVGPFLFYFEKIDRLAVGKVDKKSIEMRGQQDYRKTAWGVETDTSGSEPLTKTMTTVR